MWASKISKKYGVQYDILIDYTDTFLKEGCLKAGCNIPKSKLI